MEQDPQFKISINTDIEKYRCETLHTKEPETIEWIRSFKDDDIFYDIGANIGLYSLFCSTIHPAMQIYAFEPMISNFTKLVLNCDINKFRNLVCIYAAISNTTELKKLYVPNSVEFLKQGLIAGASGSQLGKPEDEKGNAFQPLTEHIIQAWKLSDIISFFNLKKPHHVKIDTDGHEKEILEGITDYNTIQSILAEWNKKKFPELMEYMKQKGYTDDNRFQKMENHSRIRQTNTDVENVIFTMRES